MSSPGPGSITKLLHDCRDGVGGEDIARDRLLERVYDLMQSHARAKLANEPPGHTLDSVALASEVYFKVFNRNSFPLENRRNLHLAIARSVRQILVDSARRRQSQKRGGDWARIDLANVWEDCRSIDITDLNQALTGLEAESPRVTDVLNLRFFAGMAYREIAEELGVSLKTVKRDYDFGLAWLNRALNEGGTPHVD